MFWKAIRNYAGDRRVRFVFTINPWNLDQLPGVVRIVEDQGARIMFNYFSATTSYLGKLAAHAGNDHAFFRISSSEHNLLFDADALARARETVNDLIVRYPGTVIQNRAYNDAVTAAEGLYRIDPATGIAVDCNGRNTDWDHSFRVDLQPSDAKC